MTDKEKIKVLAKALEPFARFYEIFQHMGGNTPRTGEVHTVHNRYGSATITVEHLKAASVSLKARG